MMLLAARGRLLLCYENMNMLSIVSCWEVCVQDLKFEDEQELLHKLADSLPTNGGTKRSIDMFDIAR